MSTRVAIIGAGPYGLSIAAHLAARGVPHRIFGHPMQFWAKIAGAGAGRFLKSFCFGTDLSTPTPGFRFQDFSKPRGLETFEPCSMADFASYGRWFQEHNVSWVEPHEVTQVSSGHGGFDLGLADGTQLHADNVVVATGLAGYSHVPRELARLPADRLAHTSDIDRFAAYRDQRVAVIGSGQSALEAAALLLEAGARPQLLVRDKSLRWHNRVSLDRNVWRKLRSPISKLGTGPKAWALTRFPGGVHRWPDSWRTRFVKTHLPAEGAWWLRERVEHRLPIHLDTSVRAARATGASVELDVVGSDRSSRRIEFDRVVVGTGYVIDVERLAFLEPTLRSQIRRIERAPRVGSRFESSVPGLHFVGPATAMSFGPLYRFVVGAEFTARTVANHFAATRARAA